MTAMKIVLFQTSVWSFDSRLCVVVLLIFNRWYIGGDKIMLPLSHLILAFLCVSRCIADSQQVVCRRGQERVNHWSRHVHKVLHTENHRHCSWIGTPVLSWTWPTEERVWWRSHALHGQLLSTKSVSSLLFSLLSVRFYYRICIVESSLWQPDRPVTVADIYLTKTPRGAYVIRTDTTSSRHSEMFRQMRTGR